jgi:cytochrome c7-like protein/class III cytochrome C family protein
MNLQPAAVISLVITVVGGLALYQPTQYAGIGDQTGYAPPQPIEFSHKVHAKENSIPCEYCHSGARKGPVAGIPAASTCMNCHSQVDKNDSEVRKVVAALRNRRPIEWVRVHDLPDFTRFDHSAHVNQGVSCQTCHGPVETMARIEQHQNMTMGWCVQCHREYTARPPKGITNVHASVECSACHF